ncbi:MAG TPA: PqqD family protein [Xanthomonadales bacterium]|nr:PqqD family protein [Xanthomonadales bacterium]
MRPTLAQHARRSDAVVFQEIGGEAVLLDLASEKYFALNPVGTRIWELIAEGGPLQRTFDALLAEYDVAPEHLEADLLALVDELEKAGLVKVG